MPQPDDNPGSPPHASGTTNAGTAPPDPATVEKLRSTIGSLSTATLRQLDADLPWYRGLRPDERSALGLVAQKGIASFVNWYQKPVSPAWVLSDVFGTAPTELTRSISLQKALQLIRVVVQVVEDHVPFLAPAADQGPLREAVLRYSREVAFAAADVYARAAETRGSWDTRLEALVVDAILRGESSDALRSRIAAVGWTSQARITVMVGSAPPEANVGFLNELRRVTGRLAEDVLVGIQGDRLILVLGGVRDAPKAYPRISELFGDGAVVLGPEAESLVTASSSAQAAFAGLTAARAWPGAPRPVSSEDLWPERVMSGDDTARRSLVRTIYRPLVAASNGLEPTLSAYLTLGHSLEATARALFVHANTVRYRLRRVSDVTGWDPLIPREAYVLQTALVVGRLAASAAPAPTGTGPPAPTGRGSRPGTVPSR
ncbi:PucR family transcriptional regulator [Arthrobacter agilis]|uniref:PucR family transcriptional regulator n=1 Tax=Arthrobacter agilis TaxID=37921 RepID=UPI000B34D0B7|nr:helix-turn-helix domain-containing protein [Arthrobacter agilis]OUM44798.1 PucR family transcriptional regulator [Arthrobacter agilis]PPB47122.1 PucR family transcriptional regulator [Arthrobacter agilis]TPV22536.1 PucR family transcriptional regulator [Arthrobacter agilis]